MPAIPELTGQVALVAIAVLIPALLLWNGIAPGSHQPFHRSLWTALRTTTEVVGVLTTAAAFVLILVWSANLTIDEVGVGGLVWRSLLGAAASSVIVVPAALWRRRT